jgi:hypothetical protein
MVTFGGCKEVVHGSHCSTGKIEEGWRMPQGCRDSQEEKGGDGGGVLWLSPEMALMRWLVGVARETEE